MARGLSSYQTFKHQYVQRVREFLQDYARANKTDSIRVQEIRYFLHHSSAQAMTAPILCALEEEGFIELQDTNKATAFLKGAVVYFTPKLTQESDGPKNAGVRPTKER